MAILARALGIPAVVGIGKNTLLTLNKNQLVIIDPQAATLIVTPDSKTQIQAKKSLQKYK